MRRSYIDLHGVLGAARQITQTQNTEAQNTQTQ